MTGSPLRAPVIGLVLLACLVPLGLACAGSDEAGRAAGRDEPLVDARPNLLLISLDALRADRLGAYGYEPTRADGEGTVEGGTSPFLDALAADGVLYRHAFVVTHGTPPSHTSMLSSLYQETHGVSMPGAWTDEADKQAGHRAPEALTLLPEILHDAGYATVAVTGAGFMSASFGLDQGFDTFVDDPVNVERGARRLVREIDDAMAANRPIFALFHTYEIHSPYDPPASYRELFGVDDDGAGSAFEPTSEALLEVVRGRRPPLSDAEARRTRALYDAGIRYTDDTLAELWAELEDAGFLDDALVVITSDHGEELGERGRWLHPASLYEELIRVPLLVVDRRAEPAPSTVVDTTVSQLDILPTFLAAAGLEVPESAEGVDLLQIARRDADGRIERPLFAQYGDRLYTVRTSRWKLIERRPDRGQNPGEKRRKRIELYNLDRDPGERRNVAQRRPKIASDLRRQLDAWLDGLPPRVASESATPTEEDVERLRSLGYL